MPGETLRNSQKRRRICRWMAIAASWMQTRMFEKASLLWIYVRNNQKVAVKT
jgi:hypothetical protein